MEKTIKETLLKEYWYKKWAIFRIKMIDHWQHSDEVAFDNKCREIQELIKKIAEAFGEEPNEYFKGYYTEKVIQLCDVYFHHEYENFIKAVKLLVEVE